ncbi:hypothetical protein [Sicyoidochytrium minutum DNA virus]|nr:hypothetical protein [Sicyoidochytrium minutum DNA virus]
MILGRFFKAFFNFCNRYILSKNIHIRSITA